MDSKWAYLVGFPFASVHLPKACCMGQEHPKRDPVGLIHELWLPMVVDAFQYLDRLQLRTDPFHQIRTVQF